MTKLITAFVIILVVVTGWKLAEYFSQQADEARLQKKVETGADIRPEQLEGLPYELSQSLNVAQDKGPAAFREWLKVYGPQVRDPRKAWIELDYCLAAMRDDPKDAKRVFQSVKSRLSTNSPVYPRVRQLQTTFE